MSFGATLKSFCEELRLTFPELAAPVDRAATTVTVAQFWGSWQGTLSILLERSAERLFTEKRGFILGPVRLTEDLWGELSENTRGAIWKYLRTLALEAAMEVSTDSVPTEAYQVLNDILTAERLEAGGADAEAATSELLEESMAHLRPLMDRMRGFLGSMGLDASGVADVPLPEIPEHLRRGKIAQMAEQMAKQFRPEEFGIDPALLAGDNVEEILKRLAELYQRDPTLLLAGAKRVAERIKTQILGGSLNREELLAEANEFVALFKEHPLFKEAIEKFQSLTSGGGLAGLFGGEADTGAPSERRRAVQERLRRKLAARRG
jgi:hypothetical protein